ncbi:hypothetical protein C5167_020240 [Papaver somniferum]|uniref:Uncharacterized protein n=1 Tax=Papaver somniferum TaxID=3469 RepID=A0A4Y7IVT0_PAPSO|nr:hypothetical protein C5167_020240 [Papaver somniferum]
MLKMRWCSVHLVNMLTYPSIYNVFGLNYEIFQQLKNESITSSAMPSSLGLAEVHGLQLGPGPNCGWSINISLSFKS